MFRIRLWHFLHRKPAKTAAWRTRKQQIEILTFARIKELLAYCDAVNRADPLWHNLLALAYAGATDRFTEELKRLGDPDLPKMVANDVSNIMHAHIKNNERQAKLHLTDSERSELEDRMAQQAQRQQKTRLGMTV
jgi:hypothetical protein